MKNKIYLVVLLACIYGCVLPCGKPKTEYNGDEWEHQAAQIEHIASCLHKAVIVAPPLDQHQRRGEWQSIGIDLSKIQSLCPSTEVSFKPPLLCIKLDGQQYRIQLRWVGRECKVIKKGSILQLDFINSNEPSQMGSYLYTVYDDNDVVWHTYLFDPWSMEADLFSVNITPGISPCDDAARLREYKKFFFVAP